MPKNTAVRSAESVAMENSSEFLDSKKWAQFRQLSLPLSVAQRRSSLVGGASTLEEAFFEIYKNDNDLVSIPNFIAAIKSTGLQSTDPRLKSLRSKLYQARKHLVSEDLLEDYNLLLDKDTFVECINEDILLLSQALRSDFVIPKWSAFCKEIESIFESVRSYTEGKVADYIPQLARVDPNRWGVAVCTVDGQRAFWGDTNVPWCLQSISKAFTYATALDILGDEFVHKYVGQEPSGRLFNEICLDYNHRPHNPMINAGAILLTSLIKKEECLADRFDFMIRMYEKLAGYEFVGFSNTTFLSERETADRNFALAYYMREHKCFPDGINLFETLDLYFQLCSVEVNCESASIMAATLANGGVCPTTMERVVEHQSVRDVLSLMYSCGMYDYSGQFAFQVGLPAKSAVSGAMVLVIPNVMGFALWSPRLDKLGNTIRGVQFAKSLVRRFNFHNYDSLVHGDSTKTDPRCQPEEVVSIQVQQYMDAAAKGDLETLKRCILRGADLNQTNYDGRTPLHVAASEGHLDVVAFLLKRCQLSANALDKWQRTPIDDALHFGHKECADLIKRYEEM